MLGRSAGQRGVGFVSVLGAIGIAGLLGSACAHGGVATAAKAGGAGVSSDQTGGGAAGAASVAISEGKYAVESIRSRATVDGVDQLIEISEKGSRMKDHAGGEHTLTERGALTLSAGGNCQLALAVSVDGEAPGISERTCTWAVEGSHFVLGEAGAGSKTMYRVQKDGDRYVLEGVKDVGPDGKVVGDATGERIVLVEGRGPLNATKSASRSDTEDTSTSETASVPADEI